MFLQNADSAHIKERGSVYSYNELSLNLKKSIKNIKIIITIIKVVKKSSKRRKSKIDKTLKSAFKIPTALEYTTL